MTMATIYEIATGESSTISQTDAQNIVRNSGGRWTFSKPLPVGWEKQVPKYLAMMDLLPAQKDRHRMESPYSMYADGCYQYGAERIFAGQTVFSTEFPHQSFQPLNDSARVIYRHFMAANKSRLPRSPWKNNRVSIEDGMSFGAPQAKVVDPDASKLRAVPARPQGPRRAVIA